MRAAATALPGVRLVRRVITRPCDGDSEDFQSVTRQQFDQIRAEGGFAVDWQAHGLSYGVPHPSGDGVWLMNLSRKRIADAARGMPGMGVIHVTADPGVLAARLAARGRETAADIAARIARDAALDAAGRPVITIDNSGDLEQAKAAFIAAVRELSQ